MVRIGIIVGLLGIGFGIGSLGCGGRAHPAGGHPEGGHPDGGTIEYDGGSGQNSFWKDTDGIEPESAGCHVEYAAAGCAVAASPGRNFGEKCLTGDVLVETNPGRGECHLHPGDIGHPYTVPCNAWCKNLYVITLPNGSPKRRGTASAGGRCETIADHKCGDGAVTSARCLCSE